MPQSTLPRRALFLALLLSAACRSPQPPAKADSAPVTAAPRPAPPNYAEYATLDSLVGPPAPIDYATDTTAQRLRTFLEDARKGPPDLAGHYTFVVWGCGKGCTSHLILDLRTGRTYTDTLVDINCSSAAHTRLSALVVTAPYANGGPNGSCPPRPTRYFVWRGTSFEELK